MMYEILMTAILAGGLFAWFTYKKDDSPPVVLKLWLDDERPAPAGWVRCYTAPEAITMLNEGNVDMVSLDHDLGPNDASHGTGYDVMLHLERMAYEGRPVPNISIHTANPAAATRMRAAHEQIQKLVMLNKGARA